MQRKKSSSHHSNFKSEQIFYCRPFSHYFLILILQRSPKYFPLLPDFLISYHFLIIFLHKSPKYFLLLPDLLSNYYLQKEPEVLLLLTDSLSKLSCHSPRSEALVFALRLYCYLILQVCVPALWLDRPSSGPRYLRCFSDVLRHQSEVLCVLWTVVRSSSPRYYTCRWINVSPSGPKYYPCSRMSVKLSIPQDPFICPFVCPFSFHLPFHLSFRLPFPFPFLSYPPQTSAEIIFR